MENEPRLIVPCCGDPDGDSPEAQFVDRLVYGKLRAKDYLTIAGVVLAVGWEFVKNPKGFIEVWSDDLSDDDGWIGCI